MFHPTAYFITPIWHVLAIQSPGANPRPDWLSIRFCPSELPAGLVFWWPSEVVDLLTIDQA